MVGASCSTAPSSLCPEAWHACHLRTCGRRARSHPALAGCRVPTDAHQPLERIPVHLTDGMAEGAVPLFTLHLQEGRRHEGPAPPPAGGMEPAAWPEPRPASSGGAPRGWLPSPRLGFLSQWAIAGPALQAWGKEETRSAARAQDKVPAGQRSAIGPRSQLLMQLWWPEVSGVHIRVSAPSHVWDQKEQLTLVGSDGTYPSRSPGLGNA